MSAAELVVTESLGNATSLSSRLMPVLMVAFVILPLTLRFYTEYMAYLALGPGGTPSSIQGFLRVKALGLFRLRNPYLPQATTAEQRGYLTCLPARLGPRPEVRGIAPQRQITQIPSSNLVTTMTTRIESLATRPDSALEIGTSCFEKHGTGLFSTATSSSSSTAPPHTTHVCRREVCHIHGSDGSMHLTLHPADAKLVLQGGWGERHPLSRGGRFERFVPVGFVMVYAGRDEGEVEVLMRIVEAAVWFVGGAVGDVEEG